MKIQKIITAPYVCCSWDTEEIQKALDEGWTIACTPAVVQAFANYAPEVIFVVEKELNV